MLRNEGHYLIYGTFKNELIQDALLTHIVTLLKSEISMIIKGPLSSYIVMLEIKYFPIPCIPHNVDFYLAYGIQEG